MLPLGDFWSGSCRAGSAGPFQPEASIQYRLCNLGYARETCGHFPAGVGPDAVRFQIAGDDGEAILIAWVKERDHLPFAHGSFTWSRQSGEFLTPVGDEHLAGQAFAYVASYRHRKAEAFVR
jgi:hypothetical protein